MRKLSLIVAAVAFVGCALRPRYAELVDKTTPGPLVQLQLVELQAGKPVAGALVEMSEYRNKVSVKTDAEGRFALPVDKKYLEENPIFVINAPSASGRTKVQHLADPEPIPAPPPPPIPVAEPQVPPM